jgi:F0F1-type ATP synthase assembly protein I
MTGAVLGVAIVVAILLILVAGASPLFLIPIVLLALIAIFVMPMFIAADRAGRRGRDVPTSEEASYDPVQRPR